MKQLKYSIFFLLLISSCNNQSLKDKFSTRKNTFNHIDDKLNKLAKQLGTTVDKSVGGHSFDGVDVPKYKLETRKIFWKDGSIWKGIIIDQNYDNRKIDSPDWNFMNIAWLLDTPSTTRGSSFWEKDLLKKVKFEKIEKNIDRLLKESLDSLRNIKRSDLDYNKCSKDNYQ
ncbi:MAG: hypothetical protein WCP74_13415 [Sphingobacteriia bacterium]|jgi:hypothetical protein